MDRLELMSDSNCIMYVCLMKTEDEDGGREKMETASVEEEAEGGGEGMRQ